MIRKSLFLSGLSGLAGKFPERLRGLLDNAATHPCELGPGAPVDETVANSRNQSSKDLRFHDGGQSDFIADNPLEKLRHLRLLLTVQTDR